MNKPKHGSTVCQDSMAATLSNSIGRRPPYEPPAVVTLTDRQLLAELGPAQMGGYFNPFDDMFQEGIP